MAISVWESPQSRKSLLHLKRGSSITYEVVIVTTAGETETEVIAAVESLTSWFYDGFDFLVIESIEVDPQGGPLWKGTVVFTAPDGDQADGNPGNASAGDSGDKPDPFDNTVLDYSFAWEVGGGTKHITSSYQTIQQTKVGQLDVDLGTGNLIGLS
ncbi:MAG: hypothetical protein KGR26_16170, partial [Cyanobacteria bacterium REEB65]|nr:hypothetical protein [Cyanobacteria bacterium REEB65]